MAVLAVATHEDRCSSTTKAAGKPRAGRRFDAIAPRLQQPAGKCRSGSAEWVLLGIVDDLRLDGWQCVRLADITAVVRGASERFAERVIRRQYPNAVGPPELSLGGAVTLLRSLGSTQLVALECEEAGDFLLGYVVGVTPRSVDVHAVSSKGTWGERAERVQLADLTRVQVGTHYNAMFERYASRRSRRSPGASPAAAAVRRAAAARLT